MITDFSGAEETTTTLQELLSRTPQGRAILAKLQGAAEDYPELLGGAFLPGLKKAFKKIGAVIRPITTKIAKVAAGMVGISPKAIDALAKLDPTAHKALVTQLAQTPAAAAALPAAEKGSMKPLYIGLAAGGALLLVLGIVVMTKKGR
jgi:hypothetical protein